MDRSECSCEEVLEQIGVQAPIKKNLTLLQNRSGAEFRGYMLLACLTSAWFSTHIRLINMWPTLRTGWCSNEYLDGSTWSTVSSPYMRKISWWLMFGVRPWRQLDLISQVQGTVFKDGDLCVHHFGPALPTDYLNSLNKDSRSPYWGCGRYWGGSECT